MTILARSLGVEELYVPADNAAEAATIQDVRVFGVHNIGELIDHLEGDAPLSPAQPADFTEPDAPKRTVIPKFGNSNEHSSLKPSSRGSSREAELKESDIQIRSREN